jgi:hypothetical protein
MALRAAWRVRRRLLEAAFGPRCGHSLSMIHSRCRRWSGARASSLTSAAAFRSRHSSRSMILSPTRTEKPPSNLARTGSRLPPEVSLDPERVSVFVSLSTIIAVPY